MGPRISRLLFHSTAAIISVKILNSCLFQTLKNMLALRRIVGMIEKILKINSEGIKYTGQWLKASVSSSFTCTSVYYKVCFLHLCYDFDRFRLSSVQSKSKSKKSVVTI